MKILYCQIRSADQKYKERQGSVGCLDSIVGSNAFNRPVNVWPCHGQGGNQVCKTVLVSNTFSLGIIHCNPVLVM